MKASRHFTVRKMSRILLGCVCVFGLLAWMARSVVVQKERAKQSVCSHHLSVIGVALHNYHKAHGVFPPAYLTDASGNPAHSWRVLILEVMGGPYRELYDAYDFAEPWDGPNNRKLSQYIPEFYRCPNQSSYCDSAVTNYVAITGEKTAFPPGRSRRLTDFKDKISTVAMVAEISGCSVHWMRPADLNADQASGGGWKDASGATMSSADPEGAAVLFVDGATRRYNRTESQRGHSDL